ncbi:hypothetical protein Tco_0660489 [Tanacetum coccineum]
MEVGSSFCLQTCSIIMCLKRALFRTKSSDPKFIRRPDGAKLNLVSLTLVPFGSDNLLRTLFRFLILTGLWHPPPPPGQHRQYFRIKSAVCSFKILRRASSSFVLDIFNSPGRAMNGVILGTRLGDLFVASGVDWRSFHEPLDRLCREGHSHPMCQGLESAREHEIFQSLEQRFCFPLVLFWNRVAEDTWITFLMCSSSRLKKEGARPCGERLDQFEIRDHSLLIEESIRVGASSSSSKCWKVGFLYPFLWKLTLGRFLCRRRSCFACLTGCSGCGAFWDVDAFVAGSHAALFEGFFFVFRQPFQILGIIQGLFDGFSSQGIGKFAISKHLTDHPLGTNLRFYLILKSSSIDELQNQDVDGCCYCLPSSRISLGKTIHKE